MTAEEYCSIVRRLGWTWRKAAEELGISYRLNAYYKSGEVAIAPPVAKLLRIYGRYGVPDAAN